MAGLMSRTIPFFFSSYTKSTEYIIPFSITLVESESYSVNIIEEESYEVTIYD